MRVARIAVIVVALIAGLFAMVLARSLGNKQQEAKVEPAKPTEQIEVTEVLTAAQNVTLGTSFTADLFSWSKWPKANIGPGYIVRDDRPEADSELVGAVARGSFLQGEPVNEGKLAIGGKGMMSSVLPKGYRASATPISAATSAGGFILPKDRVDVILTEQKNNRVTSETILNNVRVLAIDQTTEEKDGVKVVVGETATLELLPQQVEILSAAQAGGSISLVLRSLEDADDDGDVADVNSGTVIMVRSGMMSKRTVKQ
ncbi:Flp pilus assembly protein CpaB [uncultured Cohaesibacter sp.]|uniref:Flp pilus assembly protein CpaB n=1 Tax=uncultured Cohaesibacter sp. TaxID=1002546 RepID=UPI0029C995DB|nr:Flp pilus assembly protein CpaB [uncultured Cohaesibacter sp.]